MRAFIAFVNDSHVDNYLKEFLAFVYYGSIVNNRPKMGLARPLIINVNDCLLGDSKSIQNIYFLKY